MQPRTSVLKHTGGADHDQSEHGNRGGEVTAGGGPATVLTNNPPPTNPPKGTMGERVKQVGSYLAGTVAGVARSYVGYAKTVGSAMTALKTTVSAVREGRSLTQPEKDQAVKAVVNMAKMAATLAIRPPFPGFWTVANQVTTRALGVSVYPDAVNEEYARGKAMLGKDGEPVDQAVPPEDVVSFTEDEIGALFDDPALDAFIAALAQIDAEEQAQGATPTV